MAYDKAEIEKQILSVIKKEKLTFFNDLAAYIEPTMQTLYDWEFDKSETIKKELSINRITTKKKLRKNWEASENPTLQLALYKLIGDDDELERLNTNYNKNKTEVSGELGIVWLEEKTYETQPETE